MHQEHNISFSIYIDHFKKLGTRIRKENRHWEEYTINNKSSIFLSNQFIKNLIEFSSSVRLNIPNDSELIYVNNDYIENFKSNLLITIFDGNLTDLSNMISKIDRMVRRENQLYNYFVKDEIVNLRELTGVLSYNGGIYDFLSKIIKAYLAINISIIFINEKLINHINNLCDFDFIGEYIIGLSDINFDNDSYYDVINRLDYEKKHTLLNKLFNVIYLTYTVCILKKSSSNMIGFTNNYIKEEITSFLS